MTNVHDLYILEDKTSQKNFRLSGCLDVRRYVDFSCGLFKWKKNSLLLTNVHDLYVLEDKTSQKNFRLSVCLDVWMYVGTWTFHVDTITFEGVSGSKQNLVGAFYVWNVGLVLNSKVISWSWFWSWFWTEFRFSQKLCGATPNLADIFSI